MQAPRLADALPAQGAEAALPAATGGCLLLIDRRCPTDFGWHDIGFHNNSEVHSPTIDALARDGLQLGRRACLKMEISLITANFD